MAHRLADLHTDGWQLESGVARHRQSPETFWIPSQEVRESIKPGQLTKLLFQIVTEDDNGETEENVERMWVYVTGRVGDLYLGRLQSQASCTDDFSPGLELAFNPDHIIDVEDPPDDWEPS